MPSSETLDPGSWTLACLVDYAFGKKSIKKLGEQTGQRQLDSQVIPRKSLYILKDDFLLQALLWISSEPSEHIPYEDLHPDLRSHCLSLVSDPLEETHWH